jgi:rhodanese-related sulfurtransferase
MSRTLLAALSASLVCTFASAQSAPPLTPTSVKGVEVVTVDQAKALVGKAAFFDMRSPINFGKGHVKGATALPYDQKSELKEDFDASKDKFDLSKLPADKNAALVFYSDGPTGWKSYKAAVTAVKQGYKSVKWMREGTDGWKAKGLPLQ